LEPYSGRIVNKLIVFLLVIGCISVLHESARSESGLQYPLASAATEDGTIYIADRNLPGIWKLSSGKLSIYYQGSKQFRTPLNAVRCLATDSEGRLYAGDSATREVYRFDDSAKPEPLTGGAIGIPMSIAVSPSGALFVADLESQSIYQVNSSERKAVVYVSTPAPRGVAVDSQGRLLTLCNLRQPILRWSDKKSEVLVEDRIFEFANQIVVDAEGNAYVSDGYAKAIWKVPTAGKPTKLFSGEPLKNPVGLSLQKDRLLIADPHQKQIFALVLASPTKLENLIP
jgi:DNA-binding beta-propeller fold protein YncE